MSNAKGVSKDALETSKSVLGSLVAAIKDEPSIANIRRYEEEAKEIFEREMNRLLKTVSSLGKNADKEIKTVFSQESVPQGVS